MTMHRPVRSILFGWGAIGLLAVPLLVVGSSARSSATTAAVASTGGAEAWVVKVDMGGTSLLEIGHTSVDSASGKVQATPLSLNGQGPPSASANPTTPEAKEAVLDWTDQTGSLTVNGGYAEAISNQDLWTARAGLGRSTGTGFPLASMLLTWDQQTELLSAMATFNEGIGLFADQLSTGLAPLFGLVGIPVPRVTLMAPTGLVDVGAGSVASSSSEASRSVGFASARADASVGVLRLFGGFISVDKVSSEAKVQGGQSEARSWLSGVQIGGIPVTLDAKGIHVVNGGPFEAMLTPVFDALLRQFAAAGLTVRTIATPTDSGDGSASAVGLEVTLATPSGPLVMSIGGANATSPAPLPSPAVSDMTPALPESDQTAVDGLDLSGTFTPPELAAPSAPSGTAATGSAPRMGLIADLGPDVVRALRLTYMILLGAAAAALAYFTTAGPSRPVRSNGGSS